MKNYFVVGTSGSGKSTAAKEIAKLLSLKHVEIDDLLWLPNWTKRDPSELQSLLQEELSKGSVVMDGNYASKGISPSPGDVLVFLDYPRWLVISRLTRRSLARVIFRKELWSGNREEFRFLISPDTELNPILFAYQTHGDRHSRYTQLIQDSTHTENYIIKNPKQLRKLLGALH
jgi:adenylate kinase family enzyme